MNTFSKVMMYSLLVAGSGLLLLAALATTYGSFDIHIHDKYFLVLPRHFLSVGCVLLVLAFFAWKLRAAR
jgi:predicted membrane protein